MGIAAGLFLTRVQGGRRRGSTVQGRRCGGRRERQKSPERELEQSERINLPPCDAYTYRRGTIGEIDAFSGLQTLLSTVLAYRYWTAANHFPLLTHQETDRLLGLIRFVARDSARVANQISFFQKTRIAEEIGSCK